MNVEPQELPAEALAMLVENPGSNLVAQLLQHVAHQDQQLITLRSELARVEGERDGARKTADFNLCCTAKIQGELDAERARVAELESLLRDLPKDVTQEISWEDEAGNLDGAYVSLDSFPEYEAYKKRVDGALASAGADVRPSPERPEVTAAVETAKRILSARAVKRMEFEPSPEDVTADPSPGASERRTTHACDECGLVHDASGFVPRWTAEDIAASEKKARELADFFGVRDVIAAGDDNG